MASICGFQHIIKVHKLVVSTNSRTCFPTKSLIALSSAANKLARLLNKERSNLVYDVGKLKNEVTLTRSFNSQRYFFVATSSNTGSASKIDDFRAREEKKEEEFSKQQEAGSEQQNSQTDEVIRLKILNASLPFVTTHGWTKKSIAHGAEAIGYPGVAHGLFPSGGIELIRHFYLKCNDELLNTLKEQTNNGELKVLDPLEFTISSTKSRLQMLEPYISHWPQALAIMSLPQNVPTSLAQLLTLVDDICYYGGDRSVDFEWYIRRIGLATIFKMAEMFMLQDSSIDHQATWTFLRRRMEEASYVQGFFSNSDDLTFNVQKGLTSAFVTARNIVGIGYSKR